MGKGGGGSTKVKPTAAQNAQAEVSWKQWHLYRNMLRPSEDRFMQKVDELNDRRQYDDAAGTTNVGYQKQFGEVRRQTADRMAASGADPSGGKFNAAMNAIRSDQSVGQTDTTNRMQTSQADRYVAGLQDVVALGAGQQADALKGFNTLAENSLRKAQMDAQAAYTKQQGRSSLVGAGLGAVGAYAMHNSGGSTSTKTAGTGANAVQNYDWQWRP